MGSFSAFEETGSIATGLGAYINTTAAILGSGGLELVAQTFFHFMLLAPFENDGSTTIDLARIH